MNHDILLGKWPRLRETARQFFPELTEGDLVAIDHNPEAIIDALRRCYGYTQEEAEAALDRFVSANSMIVDREPK